MWEHNKTTTSLVGSRRVSAESGSRDEAAPGIVVVVALVAASDKQGASLLRNSDRRLPDWLANRRSLAAGRRRRSAYVISAMFLANALPLNRPKSHLLSLAGTHTKTHNLRAPADVNCVRECIYIRPVTWLPLAAHDDDPNGKVPSHGRSILAPIDRLFVARAEFR